MNRSADASFFGQSWLLSRYVIKTNAWPLPSGGRRGLVDSIRGAEPWL